MDTLEQLAERDRQLALHRPQEPKQPDRLAELLSPPSTLDASDRGVEQARADERVRLAAQRAHTAKWRENLRQYAPIERWERAWSASPGGNVDGSDDEWPATGTVLDWIASGCKRHLVLIGAVGCGKSIAAAVAVKHWVEPGPNFTPVSWLEPDALVSAVMHAYDEKSPKLCRYVVIDDMGTETKPDFGVALAKLLDRQGHTLLITSNLKVKPADDSDAERRKTFRGRYDERLISRLNDTCTKFIVPGGDRRSKDGGF